MSADADFAPSLANLVSPRLAPPIVTVAPTSGQGLSVGSSGLISGAVVDLSYNAKTSYVAARESTASAPYVSLTTAGPSLTGLVDGIWLFVHGASIDTSVAFNQAVMSIDVNGAGASDDDACINEATTATSCMIASLKTLSNNGNSTVSCMYRADAGAVGRFGRRFLIGLKVG